MLIERRAGPITFDWLKGGTRLMSEEIGPASFFQSTSRAFGETISARRTRPELVALLCAQAFDSFTKNVAIQAEGDPALACHGECAGCCRLRVVATAPEVFLLARFISVNAAAFAERGIMLLQRVADADRALGALSEEQRMAAQGACPLIERELCLAYKMRPLACRGHAAFDKASCLAAARGEAVEAPISTPHLVVRSLVQNALMASLRRAGLAWGLYEINRALNVALSAPNALEQWISGEDPLASARIPDFDMAEAGAIFDAVEG
ncbi:MAG: YkgJ family cysteine cluster protein [Methylocystis sp.]|uniref:YkgJ family cysteine cluster protein n=1 Tax=Methylocystis sp. TaxID=1911079 RepID=UPI00395CE842